MNAFARADVPARSVQAALGLLTWQSYPARPDAARPAAALWRVRRASLHWLTSLRAAFVALPLLGSRHLSRTRLKQRSPASLYHRLRVPRHKL